MDGNVQSVAEQLAKNDQYLDGNGIEYKTAYYVVNVWRQRTYYW